MPIFVAQMIKKLKSIGEKIAITSQKAFQAPKALKTEIAVTTSLSLPIERLLTKSTI